MALAQFPAPAVAIHKMKGRKERVIHRFAHTPWPQGNLFEQGQEREGCKGSLR